MPVEAQLIAGPVGPDTIEVPGNAARLNRAASTLGDLSQQLKDAGNQLRHADAPEGRRGRTVRALKAVAGRTGRVLEADADKLQKLGDAVQHQADLLSEATTGIDDLRRRWRQARQELREAIQGEENDRKAKKSGHDGGGGQHEDSPLDVAALIHDIDSEVADQHEGAIRRLAGLSFAGGGGGGGASGARLVDGEIDRAITSYRRGVDAVLGDFTESLKRVHHADEQMAEHLPRHEQSFVSAEPMGDDEQDQANVISGPDDIRSVAQEARQASQLIEQASDQLKEIRLNIREGRMLPDDDRIGSSDGFQRTWHEHFEDLLEDLRHAHKAGGEIADRLRELDDDGARHVRRNGGKD